MFSLLLRNLFFTILQPGLVAGLIPFLILGEKVNGLFIWPFEYYQYIAFFIFTIGLAIMLTCIISFAIQGKGTLSPANPTKKLVIKGLYKYSRNPMYVGVMLILIGEALFFGSVYLWIYGVFVFTAFHVFILKKEEPRLRRDFGAEYDRYRKTVRRWI